MTARIISIFFCTFCVFLNTYSQNLNKWVVNPKLNAPINNPALMGVFNETQITDTYTMGYQPTDFSVTQQHANDFNIMKRLANSKTAVGGGFHYYQSFSNDYQPSIDASGIWLSVKNNWVFKNGTSLGVGLTIGHQKFDKQTFYAALPGYSGTTNFYPLDNFSDKNLISNLGLSFYGNNFFLSLSNTGLSGLYEKGIGNKLILSVFGGLGRLNYYQTISYLGYGGVELATIKRAKNWIFLWRELYG